MAKHNKQAEPGGQLHADLGENGFGVDIDQLSARLRFNPDDAHIWLENERMLLLHLDAFAGLRREIIERLGTDEARSIFHRLGRIGGTTDAAIARRAMPHAGAMESFRAGPRLHAIEGLVVPEEVSLAVDPDTGFHTGEWIWRNSAEAQAHLDALGLSAEPVCWTLIGYASAYSSAFMGGPIEYREVECAAMGAPNCRIVGKPLSMWETEGATPPKIGADGEMIKSPHSDLWVEVQPDSTGSLTYGSGERHELVGVSSSFNSSMQSIKLIAATDAHVLIIGEPGVGKKSYAYAIHSRSRRAKASFLEINCVASSEDYLEIELFGREKQGDKPMKPGKFERAAGGTIFLEDVHKLPPRVQARLLRVLEQGEAERVGGNTARNVNVRIIAASNPILLEEVKAGRFREDLYYRLNACPLPISPLRERRADIPILVRYFLERFSREHDKPVLGMSLEAASYLLTHELKGNVSELGSIIERAVIRSVSDRAIGTSNLMSPTDINTPHYFQLSPDGKLSLPPTKRESETSSELAAYLLKRGFDISKFEDEVVAMAVEMAGGNLAKAGRMLNLSRPQVSYRFSKIAEEKNSDSA